MRIDFATLAFGYRITGKGGTPNWATSLGQGKDYKINDKPEIDELLKGMVYSSVPLSKISSKIGKGGRVVNGDDVDSPIILGALFNKVFVNDTLVSGGKFILLVTRDDSESHAGRLRVKYGPSNTYKMGTESYSNQDFFDSVHSQFGLADDACWFVSDISVRNQNELLLTAVVVNANGSVEYEDSKAHHAAWDPSFVTKLDAVSKQKNGYNKIFYGAPGCGKSHHVSKMLSDLNVSKENIFRVTFHPEYMNCDFVGQVLPVVTEKYDATTGEKKDIVTYRFNPGPFTLALERSMQTSEMVYLIIEEINRGNAAAIFGDLFQLLDRVKDSKKSNYSESEYPITNPNIIDYLVKVGDKTYVMEYYETGIVIPSNLTILATMNSSDQNVFTLDTAFKRRWLFEQISNDIKKDTNHEYKSWYIPGTNVTWETFLVKINDEILNYKIHNQTNEDKRLGKYFVTKECLTEKSESSSDVLETANNFAYKVLEYIWNDVCKIGRDEWFDSTKYRTLEDLISAFVNPEKDSSPLDVFKNIDFSA